MNHVLAARVYEDAVFTQPQTNLFTHLGVDIFHRKIVCLGPLEGYALLNDISFTAKIRQHLDHSFGFVKLE